MFQLCPWHVWMLAADPMEGWVSGVVPKKSVTSAKCPASLSKKKCDACIATKSPFKCLDCLDKNKGMQSEAVQVQLCTSCANTAAKCFTPNTAAAGKR